MESEDVAEIYVVAEIAEAHKVSSRTVERRIQQQVLLAVKATPVQCATLFALGRIKGIPPSGVWMVRKQDVAGTVLRRSVGRPKKSGAAM